MGHLHPHCHILTPRTRTLTLSHHHILTLSHHHILTLSHPDHTVTTSHPHIHTPMHPHTYTPTHPHIPTPSHPYSLMPLHRHILTSLHVHTLTPLHLCIFASSEHHICTSSYPNTLTLSPSHIRTLVPSQDVIFKPSIVPPTPSIVPPNTLSLLRAVLPALPGPPSSWVRPPPQSDPRCRHSSRAREAQWGTDDAEPSAKCNPYGGAEHVWGPGGTYATRAEVARRWCEGNCMPGKAISKLGRRCPHP